MVAFGLILALVGIGGGVLIAWLALQSEGGVTLQGAGISVTVLPITLFATGAGALLLLWLGGRLMRTGTRRRRAQREEIERLRTSTAQAQSQRATSARPLADTGGSATGLGASSATGVASETGTGGGPSSGSPASPGGRPTASPSGPGTQARPDATEPRPAERPVRGPMD